MKYVVWVELERDRTVSVARAYLVRRWDYNKGFVMKRVRLNCKKILEKNGIVLPLELLNRIEKAEPFRLESYGKLNKIFDTPSKSEIVRKSLKFKCDYYELK